MLSWCMHHDSINIAHDMININTAQFLKTRNKYELHGVNICKQHICYNMCCYRAVEYKLYQAWCHHTCEQHICYNMYFHRPVTVSCPKSLLQICSARTWNRLCTDPLQSVQNLLCTVNNFFDQGNFEPMETLSGWEAARCDEHQFRVKVLCIWLR